MLEQMSSNVAVNNTLSDFSFRAMRSFLRRADPGGSARPALQMY